MSGIPTLFSRALFTSLLALWILPAIGCKSYEKRTYDLTVQNQTEAEVVIGLVRHGPPFDTDWSAPEDVAILSPRNSGTDWGTRVPPGSSVRQFKENARFAPQSYAVLRVYRPIESGVPVTMDDMLAASAVSPFRKDVRIRPGQTQALVRKKDKTFEVILLSAPQTQSPDTSTTPPPTSD